MIARAGILLTLLWAVLALTPTAHAQIDRGTILGDGRDDDLRVQIEWGFGDTLIAERWCPVRLTLSSGDRARSGTLIVEHQGDAMQRSRTLVRFATTPGLESVLELELSLTTIEQTVRFSFVDDRGRPIRTIRFGGQGGERLPQRMIPDGPTFLDATGLGVRESVGTALDVGLPQPSQGDGKVAPTFLRVTPNRLPASDTAYDAIDALLLRGASISGLRPEARRAITRWLHAGGTLVLVEPGPDPIWKTLFRRAPVETTPRRAMPLPAGMGGSVADADSQSDPEAITGLHPEPALAWLEITDAAARRGWSPVPEALEGQGVYAAAGPVGLGRALVLAARPEALADGIEAETTRAVRTRVWTEILRPLVVESGPWFASGNHWFMQSSGATPSEQRAIASSLDRGLVVPAPGLDFFLVLVVSIAVLGILVGPFDLLVLKRLGLRHRSWLTALGYTAAAIVVALLAPSLLRSSSSTASRTSIVDALPPGLGGGAWRSGVLASFAGSSGTSDVFGARPGSWWRPVSTAVSWGRSNDARGPIFTTVHSAMADTGQRLPVPGGNRQALWTVRTLHDHGPDAAPAVVSWSLDDRSLSVEISPADPDDEIVEAVFRWTGIEGEQNEAGERWAELDAPETVGGAWTSGSPRARAPRAWRPDRDSQRNDQMPWMHVGRTDFTPAIAMDLPGAAERGWAIDRLAGTGDFGVLYALVRPSEPDSGVRGGRGAREGRDGIDALEVWRIVAPRTDTNRQEPGR